MCLRARARPVVRYLDLSDNRISEIPAVVSPPVCGRPVRVTGARHKGSCGGWSAAAIREGVSGVI